MKAPRPRGVLHATLLACLGLALGTAIYGCTVLAEWAVESETFLLKEIQVSGARDLSEYEIMEAAGIERGVNIFKVPVDEIERSLSALPTVKRCVVQRHLPGRLLIRVAERRPYFLLNCGCVWRVDREGVVLGRANAEDLDRLFMASWRDAGPQARSSDTDAGFEPGSTLEPDAVDRIVTAIRAIKCFAPDLCDVVSEICVTPEGGLVLFTSDPPHRVLFGVEGPKAESLVALSAVLGDLRRRGLAGMEVDMRFDRQLAVRTCEPYVAMRDNS